MIQCEGWRRNGGAFTFGPVEWKQCQKNALVMVTLKQDGEVQTFPACLECWMEALDRELEIIEVKPIRPAKEKE